MAVLLNRVGDDWGACLLKVMEPQSVELETTPTPTLPANSEEIKLSRQESSENCAPGSALGCWQVWECCPREVLVFYTIPRACNSRGTSFAGPWVGHSVPHLFQSKEG